MILLKPTPESTNWFTDDYRSRDWSKRDWFYSSMGWSIGSRFSGFSNSGASFVWSQNIYASCKDD